ncbi:MAG: CRTAC1 family protein, partial [Actinobacteria bacterium]|nr:CRTAC1 family protein [Actinomycetota bacterium]
GLSSLVATYGSNALDLDGDGDVDLLVCRNDGVTLYANEGGAFRAERLPIAFAPDSVPLAVSAGDIDRDGDADLYVSVFVDFPHFVPATFNVADHAKPNHLLRNDGGLSFTDVTDAVTASKQNTFTSLFVDLDGDGFQDLVVAQNTGEVEILRNLRDGSFERVAVSSGYGFWMGVATGDYDSDGDPDLAFTNVGESFPAFLVNGDRRADQRRANGWLLLRNEGGFRFHDATREAGLGGLGFAWGIVFEDVNFDGHLDLLASQNYVKWPVHRVFKFPGKVLLGAGDSGGFFEARVAENRAFSNSPVIADLDGDARPDLFWLNNDGPSRAFLNRTEANFVAVALPDDSRSLGARVRVEGGPARYVREVASSSGLGADQSPDLVFGLGPAGRADRVVITWPDGRTSAVEDPPVNQIVRVEPPATARQITSALH